MDDSHKSGQDLGFCHIIYNFIIISYQWYLDNLCLQEFEIYWI